MVKLVKKISLKKIGKSFRSKSRGKTSKSEKALASVSKEPSLPVLASVALVVTEVPAAISFDSQANKEAAPVVVNNDAVVVVSSPPSASVVIANVEDIAEKKSNPAEATNMSIASVSKHSESDMSVSSAEVDVIEEGPKEEEAVVEEEAKVEEEVVAPTEVAAPAEVVALAEVEAEAEEEVDAELMSQYFSCSLCQCQDGATPEEAATEDEDALIDTTTSKEQVVNAIENTAEESTLEMDDRNANPAADMNEMNLEPNIEIVQQDHKVAIGFYQPSVEEEEAEKEAEENDVVAHAPGFGAQTLEFGQQTFEMGAELMSQYFSCFPSQCGATPEQAATEDKDALIDTTASKKQVVNVIENTAEESTLEMDDRNENPAADMNEEARQEIMV